MKKILFLLIALVSLNSSAQWGSKRVKGNGKITTVTRNLDSFDRLSVGGSFNVELVYGKQEKVVITGEENIIPYLETEVDGNKLRIKFKRNTNIKTTRKLTVVVTYNSLESIALGGSGNITGKNTIKTDDMKLSIGGSGNIDVAIDSRYSSASVSGSGDIHVEGNTEQLKCSIAGSGSIKAYDLSTQELKASIAGSGSIRTTVKERIKASIAGSGSIYYKGNPKYIDTKSAGSGDVIDRN